MEYLYYQLKMTVIKSKKDSLDINMKAMHGIFILPAKDGTNTDKEKS